MKNQIKFLCGLALIASCAAGCNTINFNKTADGAITVKSTRFLWSSDSYACSFTTNGASLTANKSNVDSAALAAIGQLAIQAAAAAAPKP